MAINIFKRSFTGGVHPPEHKDITADSPVIKANAPSHVYLSVSQHIGAPCEVVVNVGDEVKLGQEIARMRGAVSAPIHSSVSGKVLAIGEFAHALDGVCLTVTIENDYLDTPVDNIEGADWHTLSPDEIVGRIKNAGIVGMGGAAFPTHVKLSPPAGKKIDTVILNGSECEPYLTDDYRLMLEHGEDVAEGLLIAMKALGVTNGVIAIEDNKPLAIKHMCTLTEGIDGVRVLKLKTKYPQGGEKQLINAVLKREVPAGKLPLDAGAVIINAGTAAAVAVSIRSGLPLFERIITVSGDCVNKPGNYLVRTGTLISELINDTCGGLAKEPTKIISGGTMMGKALYSLDIPVVKATSGILLLGEKESKLPTPSPCINCGRCVEVCPVHLLPCRLSAAADKNDLQKCEELRALDCMECGSCSYICPAGRRVTQSIQTAKRRIMAQRKAKAVKS